MAFVLSVSEEDNFQEFLTEAHYHLQQDDLSLKNAIIINILQVIRVRHKVFLLPPPFTLKTPSEATSVAGRDEQVVIM